MLMHVQLRIPLLAIIYLPEVHCDLTHYVTFFLCSTLLFFPSAPFMHCAHNHVMVPYNQLSSFGMSSVISHTIVGLPP
jgi:hypothetical protein